MYIVVSQQLPIVPVEFHGAAICYLVFPFGHPVSLTGSILVCDQVCKFMEHVCCSTFIINFSVADFVYVY